MIKLTELKYEFSDLEPYIDKETVEIHHTKHHQAYVDNLNKFLAEVSMSDLSLIEVLKEVPKIQEDKRGPINNNAGGVYLHNIYFDQFSKSPNPITGELEKKVVEKFGSFESMIEKLQGDALTQFGSGWSALVVNENTKDVDIVKIPNQDVAALINKNLYPIAVLDVWEHAYYLKYQNRRAEYLKEVTNLIDWAEVSKKYDNL